MPQLLQTVRDCESPWLDASDKRRRPAFSFQVHVARAGIPVPDIVRYPWVQGIQTACLQSSAARRAPRSRIESVHDDPLTCQLIDVRGDDIRVVDCIGTEPDLIEAKIVDDDDEDVGLLSSSASLSLLPGL